MISLDNNRNSTKCNNNNNSQSNLQNFIEIFWKQLAEKLPTEGCILVAQQGNSPSLIEASCASHALDRNKINDNFPNKLKLNFSQSESEIYDDREFLGYRYFISKTNINSRYLIIFSKETWSLEQKKLMKNYNQLLQQYLDLEDKYQQQKNEVKTLENLFYQMGHQLRNPLAEISIIAEIISLSSPATLCKSYARDIQNKILKLNLDIRKFLQIRKSQNTEKVNLIQDSSQKLNSKQNSQDIREILQESLKELKHLIHQKNIQVKYPHKTVFLSIDRFKLKQIFDNILSNAIYFSPPGETIDCSWQSFQTEMLISICDRGQSLSSEEMQNIFLPFYSRREDGQGLGLTIVKEIIIELKGNIWAEKIPQYGTKISFVLPKSS